MSGISISIDSNGNIVFGGTEQEKPKRESKGKSLIEFPSDFTVLDTETTGLDPQWDTMLEVSALRVRNGEVTDSFSELIHADDVDPFITELTGITSEMVSSAREEQDVLKDFFDFVGRDLIVGHNVNFDINFLYDASERDFGFPFSNDFVDTMRISRRLHPEERHHRLQDLASRYSLDYSHAHRALADCEITLDALRHLTDDAVSLYGSTDEFIRHCHLKKKNYGGGYGVRAKDITADPAAADPDNPFYGMTVVFTGTLAKMPRRQAMQIVADIGGINGDSVTSKTNFLVLGTQDYRVVKGGKSNKQKKAEQLKLKGKDIEIISEDVFYSMIGGN